MNPGKKRIVWIAAAFTAIGGAGVALILLSIFTKNPPSWYLIAGLACVAVGSICHILLAVRSGRSQRKDLEK